MTIKEYLKNQILFEANNDKEIAKIVKILEKKTDFFSAPASCKYHLAFEGGLAIHTLGVIRELKKNLAAKDYDISLKKAIKCALLHDLCKTNYYTKQPDGTFKADYSKKGHGDRSIRLAEKYGIKLDDKEKALIEFHMGPFAPLGSLSHLDEIIDLPEARNRLNIIKDYQDKYSSAVKKYPAILAIYSADHHSLVKENSITQETFQKEYEERINLLK